jgi:hypothetical protein
MSDICICGDELDDHNGAGMCLVDDCPCWHFEADRG